MVKHKYSFCGYTFEIETIYDYFHKYAKEYLSDKEVNYQIIISKQELEDFSKEYNDEPLSYLETLLIQKKVAELLVDKDTFIFHGSSVMVNGKGYIFTGPSGVGKSTHVGRLKEYYKDKLTIINDDKPFISLENDNYYVHGSPWSGKSHISTNTKVPLKAIFILYQDKENKINKISPNEAINHLIKQIHIPLGISNRNKGLDFLINLINSIDIYYMGLNLEKDSINYSIKIMER